MQHSRWGAAIRICCPASPLPQWTPTAATPRRSSVAPAAIQMIAERTKAANCMQKRGAKGRSHAAHPVRGVYSGFNSGFIYGVLNFGEAISFSLQWHLARYFGWLGAGTTFAKGVLFTQARAFMQAHLFPKPVSSLLCSDRALCLFLLHNSRLEQLLCVSSAIPLYISGWREIIYMLCYSFVVMLVMNHVRHLLLPLLALLFGSSCMPAVR